MDTRAVLNTGFNQNLLPKRSQGEAYECWTSVDFGQKIVPDVKDQRLASFRVASTQ